MIGGGGGGQRGPSEINIRRVDCLFHSVNPPVALCHLGRVNKMETEEKIKKWERQ